MPLFIALILRSRELVLQVLDRLALVSLPRLQLRLVDLQLLGRLLLLHRLGLVHLANELLFLEGELLPLELNHF